MHGYFAGIEIGDEYLKLCIADSGMKIRGRHKTALSPNTAPSQFIEAIESSYASLLKKTSLPSDEVDAVAVSVPATINNYKKGGIGCSSAIPLLNGLNIKEKLTKSLKKFVVVETEANTRAFAEYKLGHTAAYRNFILIILGKKISAGIYVNGWLVRNKNGATSELGHIIIEPHGRKCQCSGRGCLEAYASSDAIIRYYVKYKRLTAGTKAKQITIDDVYRLAQQSDSAALDAFYRMGNYLGIALINIINVVSPEAIIFAGEVSKAMKFFLPAVKATLNARAYSIPLNGIMYEKSTASDDVGLTGLIHLAKDSYTRAYDLRLYDDIFAI